MPRLDIKATMKWLGSPHVAATLQLVVATITLVKAIENYRKTIAPKNGDQ